MLKPDDPTTAQQGLHAALPRLLGDRLCLDFANSIEDPATDHAHDFLQSYSDLVAWGQHAGLLTPSQADTLRDQAVRRPTDAATTLARALALREAIDRVFRAIARGESPPRPDLKTLQQIHLHALAHAHLTPAGEGYAWTWIDSADELEAVLWPVARSAVELLTRGDLRRVKECPLPQGCSWLFYDQSKNISRRWCSMEGCGTLVKMRRYHARRRTARAASAGT
jgi:predicted RNA-binding Zn ribbon-like protein